MDHIMYLLKNVFEEIEKIFKNTLQYEKYMLYYRYTFLGAHRNVNLNRNELIFSWNMRVKVLLELASVLVLPVPPWAC